MSATTTKVPSDLQKVLNASAQTNNFWGDLTPISRRDFIRWIESAKQPETRKRRVDSITSRLASGKRRICCFAVVPMNLYKALKTNARAQTTWSELSPDGKRDFANWIDDGKNAADREVRIAKSVAKLAAGTKRP